MSELAVIQNVKGGVPDYVARRRDNRPDYTIKVESHEARANENLQDSSGKNGLFKVDFCLEGSRHSPRIKVEIHPSVGSKELRQLLSDLFDAMHVEFERREQLRRDLSLAAKQVEAFTEGQINAAENLLAYWQEHDDVFSEYADEEIPF